MTEPIAVPTRWLERAELVIYLATALLLVVTAGGRVANLPTTAG